MEYEHTNSNDNNTTEYPLTNIEPATSLMSAFVPTTTTATNPSNTTNNRSGSGSGSGPNRRSSRASNIGYHPYNIEQRFKRSRSISSQSNDENFINSLGNAANPAEKQYKQTDNSPFKNYLEPVYDEEDRLTWLRCIFCKAFPEKGGANAHSTTPDRIRKHLPACKADVPIEVRDAAAGPRTNSSSDLTMKNPSSTPRHSIDNGTQPLGNSNTNINHNPYAQPTPQPTSAQFVESLKNNNSNRDNQHPHSHHPPPPPPNIDKQRLGIPSTPTINNQNSIVLSPGDQLHMLRSRIDYLEMRLPKEVNSVRSEITCIQREMKSLGSKVEQLLGYMVVNAHYQHQQNQSHQPRTSHHIPTFSRSLYNHHNDDLNDNDHHTLDDDCVSPTSTTTNSNSITNRISIVKVDDDCNPHQQHSHSHHNQQQHSIEHDKNNKHQFRDTAWFTEPNSLVDVQ